MEENPGLGAIAFALVYVFTTVAFIPGSLLTLGAGLVFGRALGTGLGVLVGSLAVLVSTDGIFVDVELPFPKARNDFPDGIFQGLCSCDMLGAAENIATAFFTCRRAISSKVWNQIVSLAPPHAAEGHLGRHASYNCPKSRCSASSRCAYLRFPQAGATVGSILAFLLGRFVLQEQAQGLFNKFKVLKAVNRAIKSQGLKLVILLRLSPVVPFSAFNYVM